MSSRFEWSPPGGVRKTGGFDFLFGFIAAGVGEGMVLRPGRGCHCPRKSRSPL